MSFMYNPFPYDDPRAVNRPALPKKTVGAVVAGTSKAAAALAGEIASRLKAAPGKNVPHPTRRARLSNFSTNRGNQPCRFPIPTKPRC